MQRYKDHEKWRVLYGMKLWLNENKQSNVNIIIGLVEGMKG